MVNTSDLLRENLKLKLDNKRLSSELMVLKKELKTLQELPPNEMTLNQFVTSYLKSQFKPNVMPKVGGIYAYYKPSTEQLYIGQSKNMYTRLRQHFRNGKIKIDGHDSEFKEEDGWLFYVLEYIDKDNKPELDDREAYWIAMAKNAVRNKRILNKKNVADFRKSLLKGEMVGKKVLSKTIKQSGQLTNRTRGNNIKM